MYLYVSVEMSGGFWLTKPISIILNLIATLIGITIFRYEPSVLEITKNLYRAVKIKL